MRGNTTSWRGRLKKDAHMHTVVSLSHAHMRAWLDSTSSHVRKATTLTAYRTIEVQCCRVKMSGLKLYTSVISPVCRSVMLFLAANNIPYEPVEVELGQSGKNPELVAINPNVKMPCLDDDGFTMFESTAILRYLATKYNTPDHWYPRDIKARAKLDEALAWFPGNLRCSLIFHAAVLPKRTGQPRDEKKVAECTAILKKSLDILENYFLKDKQFVIGDQISIADLQFIGEVTQYWLGGLDIYKGRPNCERWVKACQEALAPHFDKLYQPVYEVRKAGTLAVQLDL